MKLKIISILLISMIGLTACNKKDEAIIIGVGDTKNDSSQNEQIIGDNSDVTIVDKNNPASNKVVEKSSEDKAVVIESLDDIKGLWVASNGILEIMSDDTISGNLSGIADYFTCKYESDKKSNLKIKIVTVTSTDTLKEDGTIEIITEETENIIDAKITEIKQSPDKGYTHMVLDINGDIRKFVKDNDYVLPEIKETTVENNDSETVEEYVLTPEEQAELEAWAISQGLDPNTGLPLEESITTEDVPQE